MKKYILFFLLTATFTAKAQKIDSIFVHLYTDSLKKGTYNYINIDGLLPNGRYLPLDTTHLIFKASAGKFIGNNLVLEKNFNEEKVNITVHLRGSKAEKKFTMYVKRKEEE